MCGIFGYVSAGASDPAIVMDGLKFLEYRGYDSWGIATSGDGTVRIRKAVGPVAEVSLEFPPAPLALGHTRWATHGGVTEVNAHPHTDCQGRLAVIHNGIVENHLELRYALKREHTFQSQTDTEVLVHLLEEEMERGTQLLDALLNVFRGVQGLSAVAVLDARTGQLAAAKNGSPLALGLRPGMTLLASDPAALIKHTRDVVFLEDGQAVAIVPGGVRVVDIDSGQEVSPPVHHLEWDSQQAELNGHPHYMSKEIAEQPRILRQISRDSTSDAWRLADMMRAARKVFLVGCGTAYHAALSGRYALAQAGIDAVPLVASETALLANLVGPGDLVVAHSQSGETIDVLEAVRLARAAGASVAALVNAEGSSLHRFADFSILLGCGPERCVLATKSYTAKLAVYSLVAAALEGTVEPAQALLENAARAVERLLMAETTGGSIARTAARISGEQHLFVLGKDSEYPLALEAALKIKEVSYMHAEGFASGELKHGVIALVTYGTPCLLLVPEGEFRADLLAAAAEVGARGADTIGIGARPDDCLNVTLTVSDTPSAPFEMAVTAQILAYNLALLRGCDPDRPRNLAKSVTVK